MLERFLQKADVHVLQQRRGFERSGAVTVEIVPGEGKMAHQQGFGPDVLLYKTPPPGECQPGEVQDGQVNGTVLP